MSMERVTGLHDDVEIEEDDVMSVSEASIFEFTRAPPWSTKHNQLLV